MSAAAATGDRRFSDFTAKQFQFLADSLPYFRAQAAQFGVGASGGHTLLAPGALDDCGAMTTALIQARLAQVGPDLLPQIDLWTDFIAHKQFRLPDGSFARHRPMPVSMWADDFYMGVPARWPGNGQADGRPAPGTTTRCAATLQNVRRISSARRPALFSHGWNENGPDVPDFYWGPRQRSGSPSRCATCSTCCRPTIPAGRPSCSTSGPRSAPSRHSQSGNGRWHQLLDRNDSYLETSASAIFTYCIAHAISQGWIGAPTYGDIAQVGWQGVSTQISAKGQVENTCVGTTFAGDVAYYYNRPVSVNAVHGYGPVLLAGAEMIRLLQNPAIDIKLSNRVYLYVPKAQP